MTITTIYLIRHGTHDLVEATLCGRQEGVSLSQAGRDQAGALGRRLAAAALSAVYASPTTRARETAAVIAEACGVPVTLDEALQEIDFGAWTGLSFAELDGRPDWRRWNEDRGRSHAPGGESMMDVQRRVGEWLARTGAGHAGEAVAAVSHGDVIKSGVAYALGLPLHFYDRFDVSPGSMTTLRAIEQRFKVVTVNEVPHG